VTVLESTESRRRTILILVLSAAGILFYLFLALGLGVVWLISYFDAQSVRTETIATGAFIWFLVLSGVSLLPVLILSISQLRGQPVPHWMDAKRPIYRKIATWGIVVWPLIVFLGWRIAGNNDVAPFLLGAINMVVAGIPILWISSMAQRKLDGGSQVRKWRIFGVSLTLMPVIVIALELIAVLILVVIIGLWLAYRLSVNPALQGELNQILNLMIAGGEDLDAIVLQLKSYILQPTVIFWTLAVMGGIMPMIEELVKPLALWFIAGRKLSPQEGFVGGVLCGAGFALMENILYFTTISEPEGWLYMAIGRAGTGVLHMLASGLVGWGLAKAWRDEKWLLLGLSTLSAFVLHGLWNILALVSGVVPLFIVGPEPTFWQTILFNLPVILLLLVTITGLFFIFNRYLRKQETSPLSSTPDVREEEIQFEV